MIYFILIKMSSGPDNFDETDTNIDDIFLSYYGISFSK